MTNLVNKDTKKHKDTDVWGKLGVGAIHVVFDFLLDPMQEYIKSI